MIGDEGEHAVCFLAGRGKGREPPRNALGWPQLPRTHTRVVRACSRASPLLFPFFPSLRSSLFTLFRRGAGLNFFPPSLD